MTFELRPIIYKAKKVTLYGYRQALVNPIAIIEPHESTYRLQEERLLKLVTHRYNPETKEVEAVDKIPTADNHTVFKLEFEDEDQPTVFLGFTDWRIWIGNSARIEIW